MRKNFIRIIPGDRVKVEIIAVRPDPGPDYVPGEVTRFSFNSLH